MTHRGSDGNAELLPVGIGLNVNYPVTGPKGVRVLKQGSKLGSDGQSIVLEAGCEQYPNTNIGESAPAGLLGLNPDNEALAPDGELASFADGYITIVPMRIDYTANDYQQFKRRSYGIIRLPLFHTRIT